MADREHLSERAAKQQVQQQFTLVLEIQTMSLMLHDLRSRISEIENTWAWTNKRPPADLFRSRRRLEAENLFLRHQLKIILRRAPHGLRLRRSDRALLVWMTWLWPSLINLSRVVQPDTILRWHRAGFRAYWRWKSRRRPGRPRIGRELRELIQRMSGENPLWGAPRIHGELLKLGFEIAESTVSKYMIRRRGPPSQTWRTFLHNHAHAIAGIDFCVVPTLTFERLF